MKGWLAVNAFFVALALISAAIYFLLGTIVNALHLSHSVEIAAYGISAVIALIGCGYFGMLLHRFIDSKVNRRK